MGLFKKIRSNPLRALAAISTFGASEAVLGAKRQLVDKPQEALEEANNSMVAEQEKLIAEELKRREEETSTEKLLAERTQMRARQRMMGSNSAGGNGTLLTGPLGAGGTAALGGRKTLLGV